MVSDSTKMNTLLKNKIIELNENNFKDENIISFEGFENGLFYC